jgi:uncharacterized protein YcbK (DUF882 family)
MGDLSKNFSRSEFACNCGCGGDTVDAELLAILQSLRDSYGQPIKIHSGFRCLKHNVRVGGSSGSQHMRGRAADISIAGISPRAIYQLIAQRHPGKLGLGLYNTFVHVDTRSGKPWRG